MTECLFPDLAATTGYTRRCRCPRCKAGHREYSRRYAQSRQKIACDRCDGKAELRVHNIELCWSCVTDEDRALILADTFRGRYGGMGFRT